MLRLPTVGVRVRPTHQIQRPLGSGGAQATPKSVSASGRGASDPRLTRFLLPQHQTLPQMLGGRGRDTPAPTPELALQGPAAVPPPPLASVRLGTVPCGSHWPHTRGRKQSPQACLPGAGPSLLPETVLTPDTLKLPTPTAGPLRPDLLPEIFQAQGLEMHHREASAPLGTKGWKSCAFKAHRQEPQQTVPASSPPSRSGPHTANGAVRTRCWAVTVEPWKVDLLQ